MPVEVMAVNDLPARGSQIAVDGVPHSNAVVLRGGEDLAAAQGGEIGRVHDAAVGEIREGRPLF